MSRSRFLDLVYGHCPRGRCKPLIGPSTFPSSYLAPPLSFGLTIPWMLHPQEEGAAPGDNLTGEAGGGSDDRRETRLPGG